MALALVLAAAFLAVAMATVHFAAQSTGRSGLIDAIWTAATGFAAIGLVLCSSEAPTGSRQWLAAGLMAVWTARLAIHIRARGLRHGDDPRYAHLRAQWGPSASRRMFLFLQIQALAGWVLAVAVSAASSGLRPPNWIDGAAVAIAATGLVGAAIADRQMERFRRHEGAAKAIMTGGLWAWSRHPNYFFEWLFWCAWPVLAIGSGVDAVIVAAVAPALMYWLLRHASGVPHLDAHLARTRPQAFSEYRARVPEFFPRLPRRQM